MANDNHKDTITNRNGKSNKDTKGGGTADAMKSHEGNQGAEKESRESSE